MSFVAARFINVASYIDYFIRSAKFKKKKGREEKHVGGMTIHILTEIIFKIFKGNESLIFTF